MEKVNKIFAYGTLERLLLSNSIATSVRYVGRGRIQAKLYDLGEYPGAVEHSESYVCGRVYEVENIEEILPQLDEYEEFYPDKPASSLFIRKVLNVFMDNGEAVRAFVYLYNGNVEGKKVIPTGVWEMR
ncbi:MAG: gamma-glutamylcyclotransferase [Archaeoglobaceae archaeon]